MKYIKIYGTLFLILGISSWVWYYFFTSPEYYVIEPLAQHSSGLYFVGSKECVACHREIYDAHILSAHYQSSAIVSSKSILGSFEAPKNNLHLENNDIYVKMQAKENSYFQNTYLKQNDSLLNSLKFDTVSYTHLRAHETKANLV